MGAYRKLPILYDYIRLSIYCTIRVGLSPFLIHDVAAAPPYACHAIILSLGCRRYVPKKIFSENAIRRWSMYRTLSNSNGHSRRAASLP